MICQYYNTNRYNMVTESFVTILTASLKIKIKEMYSYEFYYQIFQI